MDVVSIFIKSAFIDNLVLAYFLGMCSYLAVSKSVNTAVGLGAAVIFVLGITMPINWLINEYLLSPEGLLGTDLTFLRFIIFIAVIASMVQLVEMVIEKFSPTLYTSLGIFLPLITTNCAVLGVALLNVNAEHNFAESIVYGFGAAVGFSLVLILFAAMRERLAAADVPSPFKGSAIAMVTAGLMSLAFLGFAGLVSF